MKRPSELFSEADRRTIAQAIEKAGLNTSGEIVPVVAAASGRYDRAEDVFGLCLALAHAFRQFRLGRTSSGTGIPVYVSLLEHRVRVESGGAITGKLSPRDWEEVCAAAVDGLKEGLVRAIETAGRLLAPHFPILPDDRNELKNELCLID